MFTLPPLSFPVEALLPDMSTQTLMIHHGRHHAAYVEKLNQLIKDTPFADLPLEKLIAATRGSDDPAQQAIFNNAGQHWNHSLFWESLSPDGKDGPPAGLATRIARDFGSFEAFREQFCKAGTGHFGSGWLWLVVENDKLGLIATHDAESPAGTPRHALLCCDLWEHAYYLDHQNKRADFLAAFVDRLANWNLAASRLDTQPTTTSNATIEGPAPDPRERFGSPEMLIAYDGMDDPAKMALLEQWHLDLDNRLKAEEEGMSASDPMRQTQESRLADEAARVKDCLMALLERSGDPPHGG